MSQPQPPGGDLQAEVARLTAENEQLRSQISTAIGAIDVLRGIKS